VSRQTNHQLKGYYNMDFIDFVTSLAPEGETVLFLHQKGGGFIPQLPSVRRRAGGAWYVSSGSFILDRMTGGLSATTANCTHVTFLAVDDVGTKSKVPPLPPTWIIETSPGNYQWAWVLSEQVPVGVANAAERAFAEAGYTDGGAINAVRNWRIPGSVNIKPGRNRFASVLTEFHPEREFTVEQICAALGVTPAAADTATVRRVDLDDDGSDDVLAWLSESGHLTAQGNSAGWWGVVCPNNAAHTTGEIEGRYMPVNRAYTCLHEHCLEWDSVAFLTWVASQGGPQHAPGLRSELLAPVMQAALAKLTPGDLFSEATDAGALIAAVTRKELGRVEKAGWYARFAYVQDDESYFDMADRREVGRTTFNALFRHIPCYSIHTNANNAARRVEASICYDENRQAMGAPALVGITYSAGDDVLVTRDGDVYGNRWRDARQPAGAGDVSMWLDHCAALIPLDVERDHIFDVMACKYQRPNIKINHAVLHGGDEGCGKDTLWAPLLWAVCGPSLRNRGILDNDTLGSQWGYQLEAEIIILNELKEPDARERRALANKLKPIIAAPPEMIPINRKGLHPYQMVNRCFVLAFSNDPVPISLASQDRRWFCVWSSAPRMTPAAAERIWQWYKAGGFAAVAGWLARRDVSRFNPSAAPAMTEFKQNLIEHGMSMAESYLVEMLRGRQGEFSAGVIGSPFHAVCDRLSGAAPGGVKVPQAALLHALKEAGWVDCGRLAAVGLHTKKHVFAAVDVAKRYTKSELRRMVEGPPPPVMLASVK
jgi:hypothetical protein